MPEGTDVNQPELHTWYGVGEYASARLIVALAPASFNKPYIRASGGVHRITKSEDMWIATGLPPARPPEQLFTDCQVGATYFERQIGSDVTHQTIA